VRSTNRSCLNRIATAAAVAAVAVTGWAGPASAAGSGSTGTPSHTPSPTLSPKLSPTAKSSAVATPSPTTAASSVPTPAVPAGLPGQIEDLAPYVQQASCDPVAKPGAIALAKLLTLTYPGTTSGIPRECGVDGIASEHYEGRAIDWMISARKPVEAAEAATVIDWMFAKDDAGQEFANARRLGVMYMIWNGNIWGAYATGSGWRPYSSCANHPEPAFDTTCHRNHIHFSLSWDGAMGHTSFWTKQVAPVDYGPCRPADLNWALPYSGANPTPCPSSFEVTARPGSPAGTSALYRYSGILLGNGSAGSYVSAVQAALGVDVDGFYGQQTAAAVSAFRTGHGLSAGGVVDPATWRALLAAAPGPPVEPGRSASGDPAPAGGTSSSTPAKARPAARSSLSGYVSTVLRYGDRGPAVLALQKALKVKPTSGWFGPATRSAVIKFQQARHLAATGIVDAATWRALGA
jgi:peptidoglycan hydrolase-like protein with peptidoglycan-binding domain